MPGIQPGNIRISSRKICRVKGDCVSKATFHRLNNLRPAGLVLLGIILSIATGYSEQIFKSPFSPLILAGVIFSAGMIAVFLSKPSWAMYTAVFVIFLPRQVIQLFPVTVVANYFTTLVVLLAGLVWLINSIKHHRKTTWTATIILMMVYAIWGMITLFWAPDLKVGYQFLIIQFLGLILLMIITNQVDSSMVLDRLMATLELIGWMLVVASISTVLIKGYTPGTRLNVLGINENEFGIQLILAMPGVLWRVFQPDQRYRRLKRAMTFIYISLVIILIAMSGSRGGVVSLIIILLAFNIWKPTRAWGIYSLLILILGICLSPLLFSTLIERFAITPGDTLLGGREALWQATWNLILDHPWTGVGVGNARHALASYVVLLRSIDGNDSAATHNPILQIWAEMGLPGVLLFLSVLGSAIWSFIQHLTLRHKYHSKGLLPFFAVLSSTLLGYLASWIKSGGIESNLSYFLMLALLTIPVSLYRHSEFEDNNKEWAVQSNS